MVDSDSDSSDVKEPKELLESDEYDPDPSYIPNPTSDTDSDSSDVKEPKELSESDKYDPDSSYIPNPTSDTDSDRERLSPIIPYRNETFYLDDNFIPKIKEAALPTLPADSSASTSADGSTTLSTLNVVSPTPIWKPKTKKRKTILCKFCEKDVTNFERHIARQHNSEKEVKEFCCTRKKVIKGNKF